MRFSVNLKDKNFKKLMQGSSDYIDVIVAPKSVAFIVYDIRVKVCFFAEVLVGSDMEYCHFRVPTKVFLNILSGLVEFVVTAIDITARFLRSDNEYDELTVKPQVVRESVFDDIKDTYNDVTQGSYPKVDIGSLSLFNKLACSVQGVINYQSPSYFCSSSSMQVYHQTPLGFDLSIYAKDLEFMLKFSETAYNVKNMVVVLDSNFIIIATKVKSEIHSDFQSLNDLTTKRYSEVNLASVLKTLRNLSNVEEVSVNLTKGTCSIDTDFYNFSTKFKASHQVDDLSFDDLLANKKAKRDVIILLNKFQCSILRQFRSNVVMFVFKNFIKVQISPELFCIIARRR